MKDQWPGIFKKFMKSQQAWAEFLREYKFQNKGSIKVFLKTYEGDYIDDAFLWRHTKKGAAYWSVLHIKWRAHRRKLSNPGVAGY